MSISDATSTEKIYIQYNSLISLAVISKDFEDTNFTKFLIVEEDLEQSLNFKKCRKPLKEYVDLKESFFYIRNIDECISNFGTFKNKKHKSNKKEETMKKELGFLNRDKITQNSHFYLQHMMSKKFVSVVKTQDNIFVLKLLKNIDNAAVFLFRKINEKRNSNELLTIKEIFYLSLHVIEEDQFYYLKDEETPIFKNNYYYYNASISKNQITQFYIIDQFWNAKDTKSIYSGQLINIIFTRTKGNKEEQLMLCVEKNEQKPPDLLEIFNCNNEVNIENTSNEYRVISTPYTNELYKHVLNNSFWVIEEELEDFNRIKKPIQIKQHIRIKNVHTNLYLGIRKRRYNNDSIENSDSDEESSFNLENKTYEFILVDELKLNKYSFLEYNFLFYNYTLDSFSNEIIDEGKYVLKGVFRKLQKFYLHDLEYYYQSIAIKINNKNLMIKNEDDFIFKIKKIDIFKGNRVIYVKKIIINLDKEIKENKLNNYNFINESIRFFLEYLLNIDYSFKDENYEYNVPIKDRQILLFKFDIIETISNLIDNYLKKIKEVNFLTENNNNKDMLNELLSNIIKFFKFLSLNNEEIKQTIYIIALNKLLELAEIIFTDFTILIHFIFDLIEDSEVLQDYLLGQGGLLKQVILKKKLKCNMNDLLRENKLLNYIEKNHNYLLCYERLIGLNKVQYKRNEIISHVKKHIEEVKKNSNNTKNYLQIIGTIVSEVIELIKKYAILLERFKNVEPNNYNSKSQFFGRGLNSLTKKNTLKDSFIKKKNEEVIRSRKNRLATILSSNINALNSSKNVTTNPLLEESNKNSIFNLNNLITNKEENNNNNENNNDNNNENNENNKTRKKKLTKVSFNLGNSDSGKIKTNNNRNTLISIETTESGRLLKEDNEKKDHERKSNLKIQLTHDEDLQDKIKAKKTSNFLTSNFFSRLLTKKTKKVEKKKTFLNESFKRQETVRSEGVEPSQKYLNKLGKISIFIKFFMSFNLENALFIQDNFLKDIFKNGIKDEDFKNTLYVFFVGDKDIENNKNKYFESNSILLYLFHLYNMLFPNIKSKIKTKLKENKNITGSDIIEEFQNDNEEGNDYKKIDDEAKFRDELKKDFVTLDEYLCILYSIYQFCINQYAKTVYKLAYITSNFYLNFLGIESLNKFKNCYTDTVQHLLSIIAFMKNDVMERIYLKSIKSPSLLSNEFNFDKNPSNNLQHKKTKKKHHKKKFSKSETILIEYLLFFYKKCEQIRYLYERTVIYKYIKELINDERLRNEYKDEYDSLIEQQLSNILQNLNNQKKKILLFYEKLVKAKAIYSQVHNTNSIQNNYKKEDNKNIEGEEIDSYAAFRVNESSEEITKLLRKYEIEKFFKNIIYIESKETTLIGDKIIRKIRKIREHFHQIQKEILDLKINFVKDKSLNDTENRSFIFGESNTKSYMNINRHLTQILDESGKLFNMNKIEFKRKDKLAQLLAMENKTFYQKIKFCQIFKCMIEAISYYKGERDQNILIYCSYLLKIFNNMVNIDMNFHKIIPENYKLYCSLVLKSLKCISKYSLDKINETEQYLFLNICYFGIETFLLILRNCKLNFNKTKEFMENTFAELQLIFHKFNNPKYKIIYQILYTYAISRLLLTLNKRKTYDSNSYNNFFNYIYPTNKMKENILFCIETINNNSNKEHIISRKNTDIFYVKKTSYIDQDEETLSLLIPNDEKDPLILQDLKTNILPMDLSNINMNAIENKITNEKDSTHKEVNENEMSINEEFIRWDDEDELNRLYFYLNFISVYVIYLNDKNSLLEDNEDNFSRKEKNKKEDFSFNNLSNKIKTLLDYRYKNILNSNEETDVNNLISSQIETTLIKEEKKYFGEDLGRQNLDYKFHSVLLESILIYRSKFGTNNVEIQVKKAKKTNDEINDEQKFESVYDELANKIHDNGNNIIFYYFDPEYIDIILLEKIFNGIELKEDLMNYCIEEYHYEKDSPELLKNLLKKKQYYRLIENYYDEEYNLIHNHFIKNEMELTIGEIMKSFNSNDLNEIEAMENYSFKKMGEIYSEHNIKMNDDLIKKNNSLVDFLKLNEDSICHMPAQVDLLTFFNSLVYIYPKFKKSISLIYYKIGFRLLNIKCKKDLLSRDKIENNQDSSKKVELESITNILILLFSRKTNRELIEDKIVFPTMLNSIRDYFNYIILNGGGFIFKNVELLKELFHKLDFIFDHLSKDFEKIVRFMKKPINTKNKKKYIKKRNRLEDLLEFLIIFLEFKKVTEENILTEEITKFSSKVVEKAIHLLFILIELSNATNVEIIDILIDFLFKFIKGPDIDNLNLLFSLGFFNLVTFFIKNIDYYQLFLSYLKKDNLYEVIDNCTEIECKIIKIFIIYYNVLHNNYNNSIEEFEKLQLWYEENFNYIRKKLKKLYYMSEIEMRGREYDINKMLLFIKSNDDYHEYELKCRGGILLSTYEKKILYDIQNMKYRNKKSNHDEEIIDNNNNIHKFCIIKFDLLLAYYSLYNYHKDLSTKTKEDALSMIKNKNYNMFYWIINFFIGLLRFFINLVLLIFLVIYYIFRKISSKIKDDVDLLQLLTNIEIKSQIIDDQKMINFLKSYIRELEITIKNKIYKIYFPMIDKANTLEEYKEEYYKVEKIDSSDFINYLLSNYDSINIKAKQYVMINNIIKIPIINLIFKNIYIYAVLLIILGVLSNLIIMLSFSTFVDEYCGKVNFPQVKNVTRIQCPHFLYKLDEDKNDKTVLLSLTVFGYVELILQCIIFIDYIVRIFFVQKAILELKYKIKNLKEEKKAEDWSIKDYIFKIILKTIIGCIINFKCLYYILSIIFIILGIFVHPFFNCITLLEFVNRIQLMQTVLKAMYKPIKNILITLLMFIILEYLFSLFAVSYYHYHFPNINDTKRFLDTFMRLIDQTFKQDGGIGTYLDKSLDPNFLAHSTSAFFNTRFFFDLIFFLIILLLIFQMFLSTIIDYFNETRENTEDFKEGLETQCTVCGMEREKIEKIYSNDKNAFDKHINCYHNAFNYIYYLMYLQSTSSHDSIIENTIWNLHLKKNLSYLPKNVCFKQSEKKCWKKLNQKKNTEDGEGEK